MKQWACGVVALYLLMLVGACGAASNTDLFDAVRSGDAEKVKALLQADPKLVEARTEDGSTALHLAALEGQAAVAGLLLTNGAQVNALGLRGETPLHMAMYDGHREVAEVLLASQADVNARNIAGETPLHLAAGKGYRDLVELLLSQNADPGARDKSGRTPEMAAAEKEREEVVELLTRRVGDYYDVQRFVFEGAKTFPPEALRQALRRTREFFEVSHPLAQLDTYLETMQRKLLLGYQHCGFPEARIETRVDARAGRVVVTVEEGPRYVCGGIKVSGAKEVPAALILERLTSTNASTKADQRAFDFQDKAPATSPLTQALADQADLEEALWVKGAPAPFSNPDLLLIKEGVTGLLAERGYLFPKVNVQVVPDKATGKAELQVEVEEEGPRAVIERVDVVGNKTNAAEAVVRYLGLNPGMELSSQLVSRIEDRLWRAARFLGYKVSVGSPSDGGRAPLQIELAEYGAAPPLAQAFSPAEEAMLKMRDWLAKLDQNGDDMVVQISDLPGPPTEAELVMSPRSGVALLTRDMSRKAEPRDEYAFVLKGGQAGLYSPAGGRKLLLACPGTQLVGFLMVDATPAADNGSPFHISLGAGFKGGKEGMPAGPTYRFQLAVPPVACIGFAHQGEYSCWFDGDMLIRSNASSVVKLNARTGRIIEWRAVKELGGASAQIRFEPGRFAREFDHVAKVTAGLPDLANTNAPLSSTLAFLAEEIWSSKYLRGSSRTNLMTEAATSLSVLSRQFRLADILAPLDRVASGTNGLTGMQAGFAIPYDEGSSKGMRMDTMAMITHLLLLNSDELFEPRTWVWTLLREACLTAQGKGAHTEEVLKGMYESNDTGPLGFLTLAEVLGRYQPPVGRKFAARGLERLSAADFSRDCRVFLEGNSIASQCCQRLAAALRSLDDDQLAALVKGESAARGAFIRECSRRLRAAKDQPLLEALTPALSAFWEQELKEEVAAALKERAFDVAKAVEEGMAAMQAAPQDMSRATKLFREAAERGHPGAQYYLGLIYGGGMGVPKDFAASLDWYRQSATNGSAEAAVVVGNLYHDGLEVKQDYAEAFIWYSVAGARGHKMAQAFRKSVKGKLTAQQLAEAQERVEAILASRPKGGDTSATSSTDH